MIIRDIIRLNVELPNPPSIMPGEIIRKYKSIGNTLKIFKNVLMCTGELFTYDENSSTPIVITIKIIINTKKLQRSFFIAKYIIGRKRKQLKDGGALQASRHSIAQIISLRMAESGGFEPPLGISPYYRFSKPASSAT